MQNLQKKHALLEADVGSHQDRIEGIRIAANQFIERGHFDADNIHAKQVWLFFLHDDFPLPHYLFYTIFLIAFLQVLNF